MNKTVVAIVLCGFVGGCSFGAEEASVPPQPPKKLSLNECLPEYTGTDVYNGGADSYFFRETQNCDFSLDQRLKRFLELHPELRISDTDKQINPFDGSLSGTLVLFKLKEPLKPKEPCECKCEYKNQ